MFSLSGANYGEFKTENWFVREQIKVERQREEE